MQCLQNTKIFLREGGKQNVLHPQGYDRGHKHQNCLVIWHRLFYSLYWLFTLILRSIHLTHSSLWFTCVLNVAVIKELDVLPHWVYFPSQLILLNTDSRSTFMNINMISTAKNLVFAIGFPGGHSQKSTNYLTTELLHFSSKIRLTSS